VTSGRREPVQDGYGVNSHGARGAVDMSEVIDSTGAYDGLTELRRSVGGAVLAPTDAEFDAARADGARARPSAGTRRMSR
jgi:hypothetical protein